MLGWHCATITRSGGTGGWLAREWRPVQPIPAAEGGRQWSGCARGRGSEADWVSCGPSPTVARTGPSYRVIQPYRTVLYSNTTTSSPGGGATVPGGGSVPEEEPAAPPTVSVASRPSEEAAGGASATIGRDPRAGGVSAQDRR